MPAESVRFSSWLCFLHIDLAAAPRIRFMATLPHLACFKRLRSAMIFAQWKMRAEKELLYDRVSKWRRTGCKLRRRKLSKNYALLALFSKLRVAGLKLSFKKFRISSQVQTEKKSMSNELRVQLMQVFHENLCRQTQSTNGA